MAGTWRVIPHPEREWLIQTDRGRAAVSPALGRALQSLHGQAPDAAAISRHLRGRHWPDGEQGTVEEMSVGLHRILVGMGAGAAAGGSRSLGRAVWWRFPLLPAVVVELLARWVRPLACWPLLGLQATAGLALYLWAAAGGTWRGWPQGPALSVVLALFLLTALWHEVGHAAALRREGYPPGAIGAGVLFIIPVLFADVSAVAALDRRGRLRVDLAGISFQLAAGGLLTASGSLAGSPVLQTAGGLALAAVLWSGLPFIRADGYWALADLLGLKDLEKPVPRGRGRWLILFMILHRTINALFLLGVGLWLPLRLYGLVTGLADRLGLSPYLVLLPVAVFTGLAWRGLVMRLWGLAGSSWRDLRNCSRSRRGL